MSSTDRTLLDRGPCPCGNGQITVYRCVPDHGWPTASVWNEHDLSCADCSKKYTFVDGRLVLKTDAEEWEQRRHRWHEKNRSIMASAPVKRLLDKLVSRLDQEKSVAAKYRALKGHRVADCTEGTFRKRFISNRSFADTTQTVDLNWILNFVGHQDAQIERELQELEALWSALKEPIPRAKTGGGGLAA
jgi:hypothetical protein